MRRVAGSRTIIPRHTRRMSYERSRALTQRFSTPDSAPDSAQKASRGTCGESRTESGTEFARVLGSPRANSVPDSVPDSEVVHYSKYLIRVFGSKELVVCRLFFSVNYTCILYENESFDRTTRLIDW